MGAETSRHSVIPEFADTVEFRNKLVFQWKKEENYKDSLNYSQSVKDYSTLQKTTLSFAGNEIKNFFADNYPELRLKILDIMCGNCVASNVIFNEIQNLTESWIATDIFDWNKNQLPELFNFFQMDTIDSVENFGSQSNVLLLVSPPPFSFDETEECFGYADYFACKDFISQTLKNCDEPKFIIFIGEMGASDGSEGMYRFMNENENLSLLNRIILQSSKDIFGENCNKELFIYKIHK